MLGSIVIFADTRELENLMLLLYGYISMKQGDKALNASSLQLFMSIKSFHPYNLFSAFNA
jgi:hypothetical protein